MEKVRPWCRQPSDRGRLKEQNRTVNKKTIRYKKLSYSRGTARCVVSVEILPIAHASAQATCSTSPEQIEVMKLGGLQLANV